ncbi:MAG: MBL fold metallo-hydrolase [Phycisphaerales bacterium]
MTTASSRRSPPAATRLTDRLYRFDDTANVYLIVGQTGCIAIDFGSGRWLKAYRKLKLPPIQHVFLTHHHADQCAGLEAVRDPSFVIHAPAGEQAFLEPVKVKYFHAHVHDMGIPASHDVPPHGLTNVTYDMAGFTDLFWERQRIRFLHTPGHGPNAISVLVDLDDKQVCFCGDAAHAGATIRQPYHLEWDHWTGGGALAAFEGVERLAGLGIDLLCPSHGPVIDDRPRTMLAQLSRKLLAFYRAKGQICPGENDRYLEPEILGKQQVRLSPHLYQFGTNSYLLVSDTGEGMVVDPYDVDLPVFNELLRRPELRGLKPTVTTATHYHFDHSNGLPLMKRQFGPRIVLHPRVAYALRGGEHFHAPWLRPLPCKPDVIWPDAGTWRWHEYDFRIAPFAGQTWWHCAFMADIDGRRVFFGGDNFQPNSRWNGTGGFSSYNGSRFREGFETSARLVLKWKPDILVNGHSTYMRFAASQFQKIIRWSRRAEAATKALCPTGDLERDYYLQKAT